MPITPVHILRGNLTHVPDGIREHFRIRVAAALNHHQLEDGQVHAVRLDEGDVGIARSRLDHHGLKFRLVLRGFQLLLQVLLANAQPFLDLRETFCQCLRVVAKKQNAERRITIHQHAAFAIEHRSARRYDRNGTNTVALCKVGKVP